MKKSFLLVLITFVCLFTAFADGLYVKDLEINVNVNKNAVLNVSENYDVVFYTAQHGIYRDIPYRYDNVKAKVSNVDCSRPFSSYTEEGTLSLKIGSSSETTVGSWPVSLSYDYDFGADLNEGWDEVYYNLVSNATCDYEHLHFTVTIPDTVSQSDIFITFGQYGSTAAGNYSVKHVGNTTVIEGYVNNIDEGENLTMFVQLPDGWFVGARQMWDYRDLFKVINIVLSIALAALGAFLWILHGRDRIPIVSAKFNPPENFSPLVVGYLADGSVDDKDITSMLYYWADKGYLQINEKKKDSFSFTKLQDIADDEPEFEQYLFNNFFRGKDKNNTVDLKDIQRTNFAETMMNTKFKVRHFFSKERRLHEVKSTVLMVVVLLMSIIPYATLACSSSLVEITNAEGFAVIPLGLFMNIITFIFLNLVFERWYLHNSHFFRILFCFIPSFFALFFSMTITAEARGYAYIPGVLVTVISSTVLTFFASIMQKRTVYGAKVFEDTLGFKEFIDKVSLGELTTLIDEDPMYYYHNLSYAVVFGLEKTWANKFSAITVPPPTWYVGVSPFDVYFYSTMANRMNTKIREFAAPVQKGNGIHTSGGFNVGGFAGGGFGGGSVRAW